MVKLISAEYRRDRSDRFRYSLEQTLRKDRCIFPPKCCSLPIYYRDSVLGSFNYRHVSACGWSGTGVCTIRADGAPLPPAQRRAQISTREGEDMGRDGRER